MAWEWLKNGETLEDETPKSKDELEPLEALLPMSEIAEKIESQKEKEEAERLQRAIEDL